jgi:AraC-like DNA-binding protein
MILWDKNQPHWFGHANLDWSHSWICFSGSTWDVDMSWLTPLFEAPLHCGDTRILLNGYAMVLREFQEMEEPCPPIIADNIRLLLREASRAHGDKAVKLHAPDPVHRACSWILANLSRKIAIVDVAEHAGLSPSRLQQLFHDRTGLSIQVWIEKQRLEEVCYWLMHSGLTIGEIAALAGFADGFYLSRRFSKAFGQSPSSYRKQRYGEAADPATREADTVRGNSLDLQTT